MGLLNNCRHSSDNILRHNFRTDVAATTNNGMEIIAPSGTKSNNSGCSLNSGDKAKGHKYSDNATGFCDNNNNNIVNSEIIRQQLQDESDSGGHTSERRQTTVMVTIERDTTLVNSKCRSLTNASLAPATNLQAIQRQLHQNETTTRLLTAVIVVFLACETPAGILSAGCAIFGQPFFDNVYQPLGSLTDLLALINSSVNFLIYCSMSQKFRSTFYEVIFRCPQGSVQNHR